MRKVLYIFGLLTDSDIDWIARVGTRRRLKDGETLIERGKPIDSIILVLEGQLLVGMKDLEVVARRGVGEIVGEMSMVDSAPPSATVVAEGECLVLLLSKKILQQKLTTDLAFGCRFYRALAIFLADRLRELQHDLAGDQQESLAGGTVLTGELSATIRDNILMAGERFDRVLKVLTGV
jgi:CRP/FNR family transcriptional regulator, cyclic AMP receptor protein